jgi:mxaK protein
MLEQAKERYRELLRIDAGDWDARYNLERALWLAPETNNPPADRDAATQNAIKQRGSVPGYLP